jgi:hypothetical protein
MLQAGNNDVVALMEKLGLPMDRETYLDLAYFGDPPEELSAEEEAELPEQFQETTSEAVDGN